MVSTAASPSVLQAQVRCGFYEELARTERDISVLAAQAAVRPDDLQGQARLAFRMFHYASLTGRMTDLEEAEKTVVATIGQFGPKEDLCLLKANLDLRLHRLREVRRDLDMAPLLPGRAEARALYAEVDFQEGRYADARARLEELMEEDATWDVLARLAYWKSRFGEDAEADALYVRAEDELTAKQMQSYAWLELQRGKMDFDHGRFAEAWGHYRRAEAGYPGHWLTAQHMAELHAAEGRFAEAEVLLKEIIARTLKPEFEQALGELYLYTGRIEMARAWLDRALVAYLDSVRRGRVHYLHHLAEFYADTRPEPAEALRWARRDAALRPSFFTQATLGWALYRNGQIAEALECLRDALGSGVRDAVIFHVASKVHEAAGDAAKSGEFTILAFQANPYYRSFRMHH